MEGRSKKMKFMKESFKTEEEKEKEYGTFQEPNKRDSLIKI